MTGETLTQSELDEIIGKLERALERGEISAPDGCVVQGMMVSNKIDAAKYRIRRKPIAGWVNVYANGFMSHAYATRGEAEEKAATTNRIACVYVEETEAPGDE